MQLLCAYSKILITPNNDHNEAKTILKLLLNLLFDQGYITEDYYNTIITNVDMNFNTII